ncbi:MAG: cyanophycin synthetase [Gemmatimonadales bacterium]
MPNGVEIGSDGHPILEVDGRRVRLGLKGRHQAANAMLVWALARELGLDLARVASALESCSIPGGRGELLERGGLSILNDAYNANPASFRAAIDLARVLRGRRDRRLVFVAGSMRELGEESAERHREAAGWLVELEPDLLAAVGEFVEALAPHRETLGDRLVTAPDAAALAPLLAPRLEGNELIVLKGSRGEALERLLPVLTATTDTTA